MAFEHTIKKISHRDWEDIFNEFSVYLQDYPDLGMPPESSVDDLLFNIQSQLTVTGTNKEVKIEVPSIQLTMLRESIYLAHKACAIAHNISHDLAHGRATYPEVSAYNASMYLSKALCLSMGIWLPTVPINNKLWVVDCMSKPKRTFQTSAHLVPGQQLGHREVWMLLQRIFNTIKKMPFDAEIKSFITGLNLESFSKNRNTIFYSNCAWLYNDLHLAFSESDWQKPFSTSIYANIHPDDLDSHFNYHLMLILFRSYLKVLDQFKVGCESIKAEFTSLKDKLLSYTGMPHLDTWFNEL